MITGLKAWSRDSMLILNIWRPGTFMQLTVSNPNSAFLVQCLLRKYEAC